MVPRTKQYLSLIHTNPTLLLKFYIVMATVTTVRKTDDICQPSLTLSTHPIQNIKIPFVKKVSILSELAVS